MTVVKRSEAIGKRVIQTRWVDREKSPTPSTLSQKTMLAASPHDRNSHPEREHITIAIDVHTAFLHADIDQDLFAESPEPDEFYD